MSRHVPVLTEVVLRAWGTDDPRVLPPLRAENQPGRNRRATAVGRRAHAAGWPVESATVNEARQAQVRALRRLEPMDFTPLGKRDRYRQRAAAAAYESRRRVEAHLDVGDGDDDATIFDE